MLVKTQYKINTELISQHTILYPPYSHIAIINTGATIFCNAKNTINKQFLFLPLHVKLPNGTVLKSTNEGNLQLSALPKEATKAHVFPHITSGALILVAQLCEHGCIATFTSNNITICKK